MKQKPKFNLFSLINDKKERKGGISKALTDFDMALFLSAFSAVFGILHYKIFANPAGINVSIWGLILTLIFCTFWIWMAFSGGRYLRKGFWITALVIWGMALLCAIANLNAFKVFENLPGTVLRTMAGYAVLILSLFFAATVFPILPGIGALGYLHLITPTSLVIICIVAMVVQAAAFACGWQYQKKHATRQRIRKNPADVMRQQNFDIDLKG